MSETLKLSLTPFFLSILTFKSSLRNLLALSSTIFQCYHHSSPSALVWMKATGLTRACKAHVIWTPYLPIITLCSLSVFSHSTSPPGLWLSILLACLILSSFYLKHYSYRSQSWLPPPFDLYSEVTFSMRTSMTMLSNLPYLSIASLLYIHTLSPIPCFLFLSGSYHHPTYILLMSVFILPQEGRFLFVYTLLYP